MKITTTREITVDECPWLQENIPNNTELYTFHGVTYGCIGPNGIAVCEIEGEFPFFEIPANAIQEI